MITTRDEYTNKILSLKKQIDTLNSVSNKPNGCKKCKYKMEYIKDELHNSKLLIHEIMKGEIDGLKQKMYNIKKYEAKWNNEGIHSTYSVCALGIINDLKEDIIKTKQDIQYQINMIRVA